MKGRVQGGGFPRYTRRGRSSSYKKLSVNINLALISRNDHLARTVVQRYRGKQVDHLERFRSWRVGFRCGSYHVIHPLACPVYDVFVS